MSQPTREREPGNRKRRYLLHLLCMHDESSPACRYIADIRLWTGRSGTDAETYRHSFADVYELIQTINPLLPRGSDVRDVLSHIDRPDGFLYLLYLNATEAATLGWLE